MEVNIKISEKYSKTLNMIILKKKKLKSLKNLLN